MEGLLFYILYVIALCGSCHQHSNNRVEKEYGTGEAEASLQPIYVDPKTNWFVDTFGRVRIFRGINLVTKHPPWYPEIILEKNYTQDMKSWGFNVVRLGTMWAGMEPSEGHYDENYKKKLDEIISGFEAHGIYSLLDLHQDVLSSKFGTYDGVPRWLVDKFPDPVHPYPWPLKSNDSYWGCSYITQAASNAFQLLYNNYIGAADKMAAVWKYIASRYSGRASILGYELINEPWAGGIYDDFELVLSGYSGKQNLAPLYEKLHSSIRQVDNETLIFFEPVTWGCVMPTKKNLMIDLFLTYYFRTHNIENFFQFLSLVCGPLNSSVDGILPELLEIFLKMSRPYDMLNNYSDSVMGTGFEHVPGGDSYRNRSVLSWHHYCWLIDIGQSNEKYDPNNRAFCNALAGPNAFGTAALRVAELGGGGMLTEFGSCAPNASLPDTMGYEECEFILESAEKYFTSWTYWEAYTGSVFWDGDGNVIPERVKLFARPFARAIAGIPHSTSFDPATRIFYLTYKPYTVCSAPTEVFVGPMHYPGRSFRVEVSSDLQWSFDVNDNDVIQVWHSSNILPETRSEYSLIQITPFDIK